MSVQILEEPCCGECGSPLTTHEGFHVCRECGTTDTRHITTRPYEYDRSRAKVLGSDIGYSSRLPEGKFFKLRREQIRTRFRNDRFYSALKRLEHISRQLNFTECGRERSIALIKQAKSRGWNSSYTALSAACMLVASKEEGLPVGHHEIVSLWSAYSRTVTRRNVNKTLFWLMDRMNVSIPLKTPLDYLPRMISALQMSLKVNQKLDKYDINKHDFFCELTRQTRKLIENSSCLDYGGRSPKRLAASAVYVIGKLISMKSFAWTQKGVTETCGIPSYTLRGHTAMWWRVLGRQAQ